MEPIRVVFYLALGLLVVTFLLLIYNTLIGNLNHVVLSTKEVSSDCLKDCSKCVDKAGRFNQAECVTADCTWIETTATEGRCVNSGSSYTVQKSDALTQSSGETGTKPSTVSEEPLRPTVESKLESGIVKGEKTQALEQETGVEIVSFDITPKIGKKGTVFELSSFVRNPMRTTGLYIIISAYDPITDIYSTVFEKTINPRQSKEGVEYYVCDSNNCGGDIWNIEEGTYRVTIVANADRSVLRTKTFEVITEKPREICKEILKSGNSLDKLDIVFFGVGKTDADRFHEDVKSVSDRLLSTEPFAYNKNKINIWMIDDIIKSGKNLDCSSVECKDMIEIDSISSFCYDDQIVVLSYVETKPASEGLAGGYAKKLDPSDGFSMLYRTPDKDLNDLGTGVVHELGHAFGLLGDEYSYELFGSPAILDLGNAEIPINCAGDSKCYKWTGISEAGCYNVCGWSNLYRSSLCSLMGCNPVGSQGWEFIEIAVQRLIKTKNSGEFNAVSKMELEKLLAKYK